MQGNRLRSALGVWQGGLTNNQANWKTKDLVWRDWVGVSTNATCQPEKLENSQVNAWGSASI